MTITKEIMKDAEKINYSRKRQKELIEKQLKLIGSDRYLSLCMEEIAELNNVITNNILYDPDYIHTVEEIVDVLICVDVIKIVSMCKDKSIKKNKHENRIMKDEKLYSIHILSNAQFNISKYIRYNNLDRAASAISYMLEATSILIDYYRIKNKDIDRIRNLKFKRLEDRLNNK